MSQKCSLQINTFTLQSGAVICEHIDGWHTLYYQCDSLLDIVVNSYTKQYMKKDVTDLTLRLPNYKDWIWKSKYAQELNFVMLLCKENVGE